VDPQPIQKAFGWGFWELTIAWSPILPSGSGRRRLTSAHVDSHAAPSADGLTVPQSGMMARLALQSLASRRSRGRPTSARGRVRRPTHATCVTGLKPVATAPSSSRRRGPRLMEEWQKEGDASRLCQGRGAAPAAVQLLEPGAGVVIHRRWYAPCGGHALPRRRRCTPGNCRHCPKAGADEGPGARGWTIRSCSSRGASSGASAPAAPRSAMADVIAWAPNQRIGGPVWGTKSACVSA